MFHSLSGSRFACDGSSAETPLAELWVASHKDVSDDWAEVDVGEDLKRDRIRLEATGLGRGANIGMEAYLEGETEPERDSGFRLYLTGRVAEVGRTGDVTDDLSGELVGLSMEETARKDR